MTAAVLFEFRFSHFNEKARWALEYAGVPYQRATQVPGMHMRTLKSVSGQSSTPVLQVGDRAIIGSQTIAEWAHAQRPERRLLPADAASAKEIQALCAELDDALGAPLRRALFHHLLEHQPRAVAQLFGIEHGLATRLMLRGMLPMLGPMLRKLDHINAETAAIGMQRLQSMLDLLADRRAGRPFMVGDQLSLADITAAALLFPVALPKALPFALPPLPAALIEAWAAPWQAHETIGWVRDLYRGHRVARPEGVA